MIKTSIIIPAYCEQDGLPVVVDKLLQVIDETCEIVVVDDGSTDRTAEVARRYPCNLVQHAVNQGKGNAIRSGIQAAKGEKVIWIDADDTYPTSIVPLIIQGLDFYDMVVCSRAYGKKYIPKFNRVGVWLFRTLIRNIYGFKGYDPCTGLYGARKSCLQAMRLTSSRFAIEPEISIKGGRMGLKTLDVSIEYRKRTGLSKLNVLKTGYDDLYTIGRFLFWKEGK